ncbi:MAG: hypothetical protein H6677_27285 [Candidatus Obscuribacterales bacterium]|nr:hypothetical protein [Cyanobacteria bacterium HKST-UBA01]MCB9472009.1 hypothetical protein [Candidatus Obscuribacterales bacterium]
MTDKENVEALNLDLEHEMSSIIRYLHHSFLVRGPIRGPLNAMFKAKAKSSMQHAIALGEKISALGGHPSVKIQTVYKCDGTPDTKEMLEKNLNAESAQLELYLKQHKQFENSTPLRQLLEQLIMNEVAHIEELEMYLREEAPVARTAGSAKR